jgi:hypothetical protein
MTDLNASNTNGPPALDANDPNLWHTEARASCHPRGLAVRAMVLCKLFLCGQVVQFLRAVSIASATQFVNQLCKATGSINGNSLSGLSIV